MTSVFISGKLPTLNEYINVCRRNKYAGAKLKKDVENMIMWQLGKLSKISSSIIVHFEWHEKTRRRDKDNVAFAKKFVLDAMQKSGKLINDNNNYIYGFTDRFVYGVEYGVKITIEEVKSI